MNATILLRKLLGLSVVTRARSGFLVALVMLVTIAAKEATKDIEVLARNEAVACIVMAMAGFLCWLGGRWSESRHGEPEAGDVEPAASATAEHPLEFLKNLKYWGIIIILSAGILSVVTACHRRKPVLVVQARTLPAPKAVVTTITNVVTITNEAPRVSFPRLDLRGLIVNGANSSALINGRVLGLGEQISNAVLVAVVPQYAAVAFAGRTNLLVLRK